MDTEFYSSRSPHGERGLKSVVASAAKAATQSLSSRRAWIEIKAQFGHYYLYRSLSSRRAWIEILRIIGILTLKLCRSPHGERGLKSVELCIYLS